MEFLSIIFIAIGLSMDSFAVSVSNGLVYNNLRINKVLVISLSFAFFQGLMPIIGWLTGIGIEKYIKEMDHWVAFILLGLIGIKMIHDGLQSDDENEIIKLKPLIIIAQSIATSIDAFIIGVSFALLGWIIIHPAIIIFISTLIFSVAGFYIGKLVGNKIGGYATIIGGIVLIGIGTKIFIEHLFFQ